MGERGRGAPKAGFSAASLCSPAWSHPGIWRGLDSGWAGRAEQGCGVSWGLKCGCCRHGGTEGPSTWRDEHPGVQRPGWLLLHQWDLPCASGEIKAAGSSLHGSNGVRGGESKTSLVIKHSAAVLPGQAHQEINDCVGQPVAAGKSRMSCGDAVGWETPSGQVGIPTTPGWALRYFLSSNSKETK